MKEHECLVFYGPEMIKTTNSGYFDLDATKHVLRELTTTGEPLVCEVLFDLRGAPCALTLDDLDELAREVGRLDHLFVGKIALVYEGSVNDPALETSSDGRYQVAHFNGFDEAMHWLTA